MNKIKKLQISSSSFLAAISLAGYVISREPWALASAFAAITLTLEYITRQDTR